MEKFLIYGQDALKNTLSLLLPSTKHFEKATNTKELGVSDYESLKTVFNEAIERRNNFGLRANHLSAGTSRLTNALVQFLSKHPFPVAQGPVKFPIDCFTEEEKTVGEIMKEMTFFGNYFKLLIRNAEIK